MNAAECKEAGLVLDVFPDADFRAAVQAKAAKLAGLPPESLAEAKALIARPDRDRLRAVIAAENAALARLGGGAANREAIAAFREKRPPDFSAL
jgi:2-(1,2-epoxy-1,2-dihydrophenyl)acetyl-CoA isomerase